MSAISAVVDTMKAMSEEILSLREQVAALESREVCTVAHENVETCGYCQRDALTAENTALQKRIENCVMELDRRASALQSVSDERDALRKDADATRRRQLYELAGYLSVELPELHGVLGGRLVNVVDAYRAKIGDGIRPEELT